MLDPSLITTTATLVAWARSWRAGHTTLDQAIARVNAVSDTEFGAGHEHVAMSCPESRTGAGAGVQTTTPLKQALATFARVSPEDIRLVLPKPGAPLDLPGPSPFTVAALAAGHGAVFGGEGLIAEARVTRYIAWQRRSLPAHNNTTLNVRFNHPSLKQLNYELDECLRESAVLLGQWGGQHLSPEVVVALHDLRTKNAHPPLPPSYPPSAHQLAPRALMALRVVSLATTAPAGAATSNEMTAWTRTLASVADIARQAYIAAINAPLEVTPAPGSRSPYHN